MSDDVFKLVRLLDEEREISARLRAEVDRYDEAIAKRDLALESLEHRHRDDAQFLDDMRLACQQQRVRAEAAEQRAGEAEKERQHYAVKMDAAYTEAFEWRDRAGELERWLEIALGALADIALADDMTEAVRRHKAQRIYDELRAALTRTAPGQTKE